MRLTERGRRVSLLPRLRGKLPTLLMPLSQGLTTPFPGVKALSLILPPPLLPPPLRSLTLGLVPPLSTPQVSQALPPLRLHLLSLGLRLPCLPRHRHRHRHRRHHHHPRLPPLEHLNRRQMLHRVVLALVAGPGRQALHLLHLPLRSHSCYDLQVIFAT